MTTMIVVMAMIWMYHSTKHSFGEQKTYNGLCQFEIERDFLLLLILHGAIEHIYLFIAFACLAFILAFVYRSQITTDTKLFRSAIADGRLRFAAFTTELLYFCVIPAKQHYRCSYSYRPQDI